MTKKKHYKYLNIALLLVCNPCQSIQNVSMCVFENIISTCSICPPFFAEASEAQDTELSVVFARLCKRVHHKDDKNS